MNFMQCIKNILYNNLVKSLYHGMQINFYLNEQIFEIVNLADELLPPLPEGTISNVNYSSFQMRISAGKTSPSIGSGKEENGHGTVPEASAHEKILCDQPKLLQQFGVDLLPVLVQVDTYNELECFIILFITFQLQGGFAFLEADIWIHCECPSS